MPRLPKIQREAVFTPTAPDLADAEFQFSLAERLDRFAQRSAARDQDRAVKAAEQEGLQAGSGQIQRPVQREGQDVVSEAFNRGALQAHRSAVRNDVRQTLGRLEDEHGTDGEGFSLKLSQYRSGLISELDPSLQPDINDFIDRQAIDATRRIQRNVRRQMLEDGTDAVDQDLQQGRMEALRAAREGDLEAAAAAQVYIDQVTEEGIRLGVMDAGDIRRLSARLSQEIDRETIIGQFQRTLEGEGISAAEASLARFRKQRVDMLPEDKDRMIGRMSALIRQRKAAEQASTGARDAEIRARIKDAEAQAGLGVPITDETLLAEIEADPVLARKFGRKTRELYQHAEIAREFALGTPAQREAELLKARQRERLTGEQARLVAQLEQVNDGLARELRDDPRALAARQFPDQVPNEPLDPQDFAGSLQKRLEGSRFAEAHYSATVPLITGEEAVVLSRAFDEASVDERMTMIQSIVTGAGDHARSVLGMLDAKGARTMALAGEMLAQGVPEVSRAILSGAEQIRENRGILPKDTDIMPKINDALGTAFPAAGHRAEVVKGIKAVYAASAAAEGDFTGELDDDRLEGAIDAVTGGVVEYNGVTVEPPRRGVGQDDFEAWIDDRISEADIQSSGGVLGFSATAAIDMLQDAQPVAFRDPETGEVGYMFRLPTGFLQKADDSGPLVLHYTDRSLAPRLQRPERDLATDVEGGA